MLTAQLLIVEIIASGKRERALGNETHKYTGYMTTPLDEQQRLARHISGTLAQAVGFYIGMCGDIPGLIAESEGQSMIPAAHAGLRRDALEIAVATASLRMAVREWSNAGNTWSDEHDPLFALSLMDLIGASCVMVAGARIPTDITLQPLVDPNVVMDLYEEPKLARWEKRHPPLSPSELRTIAARFQKRERVTPVR